MKVSLAFFIGLLVPASAASDPSKCYNVCLIVFNSLNVSMPLAEAVFQQ